MSLRNIGTRFSESYISYQNQGGDVNETFPVNQKRYITTFEVIAHEKDHNGILRELLKPIEHLMESL